MSHRTLLIYMHALAGGGAERVCAVLARELHAQGWRLLLAVDRADTANAAFVGAGINVIVLGDSHVRGILRLAGLLRREKPDVSFSALSASNLKHAVAAVLSRRGDRAVLSYHAFAASEPQRLSQMGYRLLAVLSRLTARTVAVSESLRRNLMDRWHAAPRRTVTIHNPVRVGPDTTRLHADASPPLILSAGRLVPDKNMRAIVRAFATIAPHGRADLVIIGEGPDRGAIAAEAERLGVAARVHLPGYLTEPWDYYRRAACFVTASRLESFSMVVAEALSYGLPVVACDSPGPREVLSDGRFGTLVAPGDEAALAAAMKRALEGGHDEAAARARGEAFSVAAGVAAYARLFDEVATEAGPTGRA